MRLERKEVILQSHLNVFESKVRALCDCHIFNLMPVVSRAILSHEIFGFLSLTTVKILLNMTGQ